MKEIKEKGAFLNPYVIQMDKFADSMVHLSKTFFTLEGYKGTFSKEEFDEMFQKITDEVCEHCEKKDTCLKENRIYTYQMMYEILCAVEEYGAELNVELKRKMQKKCILAPRFLRETLEVYENAKKILMWNNKIVQNREGYAGQLKSFARLLQYTTRELDAGIFEDEHLEKKLKNHLKKMGVKMLSSVFYITPQGKYEIHLTVKAMKGLCVATKELAYEVGSCIGRTMMPQQGERPIVGTGYCTIACVEGARFQTLQGVARIGKDYEQISGDTFLMTDLPGGRKGVAISDGMGSGEEAFKDSTMVVEMLEELLEAGFPAKTAIEILNTALVIGREDVRFSTIDVCLFDLYTGSCEFVKAGAAATFIKRPDGVEKISLATLPVGVIKDMEIESTERELESGDFVIMVTDGVMDALPVSEQDALMSSFIEETNIVNPTELARYLLGKVLEWSKEKPTDDMTILTVGVWKL
ncbi:MAG: SpoIIE family protein phosphatase [Lachnospiraceae bacterium]